VTEWLWPLKQAIIDFQREQIDEHGGLHGIKNDGDLEAALARPLNRAADGEPDVAELAAAFAFGLAKAHAFNDGNKRIAWITCRLFLIDNGVELDYGELEAIDQMLRLTAGVTTEDEFAAWIRPNLKPL